MNRNRKLIRMVMAALLCSIGIIIPMFSPIKLILEPASFTLASHVPIFIAMFISPSVAIAVSIGTSLGFFLGGFPLVIVLRAVTHVFFASIGAFYLKQFPGTFASLSKTSIFAVMISVIHAVGEILIVMPFYFSNTMTGAYYEKGFLVSVILLVGIGTVIHSLVDFAISYFIWKPLKKAI